MTVTRAMLHNQLKLVVWDLDDTLWQGTLSEGPVAWFPGRADVIRTLNRRGIVNSICSKNDEATVRDRLVADGLWDEFVFTSVNWQAKGQRLAQLIDDMQLRSVNVLFVDDNVLNLQEAEHYCPGIMTALPDVALGLLEEPNARGKPDPDLKRLVQYRLLEQKRRDRSDVADSSNEEFLAGCDIHVFLGEDCVGQSDRLIDLLNRSNQLNFTKRRFTEEEFADLLAEPGRESRFVRVSDKYGEYGITGFYSVRDGRLDDFTFSCRTMNMGIEQWIYNHLGRPTLEIVGDVASTLDDGAFAWITLDGTSDASVPPADTKAASKVAPVLLKGGCDLTPVHDFLGGQFATEFSYNGANGANIQGHHTEILLRCHPEFLERYGEIVDRLPFIDRGVYTSELISAPEQFDSVVYSVLMDYTQGLYRYRDTDFVVPQGQFTEDITDPEMWDRMEKMYGKVGLDRPFLQWFAEDFSFEGPLTAAALEANLTTLWEHLPAGQRFVIINGAEVAVESDREPERYKHHQVMNAVLDRLSSQHAEIEVLDVRRFIRERSDVTDNIRHYPRRVHIEMAGALGTLLENRVEVDTRALVSRGRHWKRRVARGAKRRIARLRTAS